MMHPGKMTHMVTLAYMTNLVSTLCGLWKIQACASHSHDKTLHNLTFNVTWLSEYDETADPISL